MGSPGLFTQSVFEMDFDQGANGQYRGAGGAWQDFGSWDQAGNNSGWSNGGVDVQTTDAVRTELVPNATGAGRVLHTWIVEGDKWMTGAAYPRTELITDFAANVPFGSEWRLEMPFYADGDVSGSSDSIIGFQFHQNGGTGSPPLELDLNRGALEFNIEEDPNGPELPFELFKVQSGQRVDLVVEIKFGYASDGAYVKIWANGTQYVNLTGRNVGYPATDSNAGYWKFCSLYDWSNGVSGTRSVYCGPKVKLSRRP